MAAKKTAKAKAKTAAAPKAKTEKKGTSGAYESRTKEGRAKIDTDVVKQLSKKDGKGRGDVAKAVGLVPAMASASLGRLETAGLARHEGERGAAKYFLA